MAIPESQLTTWSSQGSIAQSKDTYASIRNALEAPSSLYKVHAFSIFLQGSYANDTNIYADSDVDVVIRLDSIFRGGVNHLSSQEQVAFDRAFPNATYAFSEFRQAVHTRLKNAFGDGQVTSGDKALHIKPGGGRRSADVIACLLYRRYLTFTDVSHQGSVPGIIIPGTSTGDVINYPKLHSENLTAKHQETGGWLKPTIRIFKNMRNRLIDEGEIDDDTACSYYVEGMLYNAPKNTFGASYSDTFCNCFNWLWNADRSKLVCPNSQYMLLGNSNVQWTVEKCDLFLNALLGLWNDW